MGKQEILNTYKRQEDKMLLAQVLDKINMMEKSQKIETTDFLDMYQISLVETFLKKIDFRYYILFGGFDDAERKILIVYPEKYTLEMIEKNYNKFLKIVRVELSDEEKGKYTHRNYLGGIVKLGLKREKVGDILVFDDGADIITVNDFSKILESELGSLTRFQNSKINSLELKEIRVRKLEVEEIKIIVPSLRLDNFVSDLARTSRSKAVEIIDQERVFVNGKSETKASKQIKKDDILTIRGKGRFVIKDFVGNTRSGRTVVLVEKYV
ncbi:MAG: hypothetical protein J6I85_06650 [Clostridia bacterium]|nr:hypothetical protein [Clostridia bacterium]